MVRIEMMVPTMEPTLVDKASTIDALFLHMTPHALSYKPMGITENTITSQSFLLLA